ncbi:ROK family protein [Phytoactinopolyspora endophytica]|uniref:ROK family protein n=1 Tax=Phytoactinopolyspora endophytica TaxID=1642495 RepID=UPI00101DC387|nr:ROK family protein [Phytoactinopolyspora endophytica]
MTDSPEPANSSQLVRQANAAAVLRSVWDTAPFTASEVMATTGLTRSTVLGLCDELVARRWITELEDARTAGQYQKGRPARRYIFNARAAHLVGVDAGHHRVTASVADLRGKTVARIARPLRSDGHDPEARLADVQAAVDDALRKAGAMESSVLAAVIGVPAPTDTQGLSPLADERHFWPRMNPGFVDAFARSAQTVVVENDANLAAVAEGAVGAGVGLSSFATLLSGERFGAGLIVDGNLLKGRFGGAGEMRLLDIVEGVGSTDGLGYVARELVRQAVDAGDVSAGSPLARTAPDALDAADVFDAAELGDRVADTILDKLADRLARVCAVITALLDVERIIVGGAIAPALNPVVERATERLGAYIHPPVPTIVASTLGADSVSIGAVGRALATLKDHPLDFTLRPAEATVRARP